MALKDDFVIELKALLKKYNASICFAAADCSDWYGMYDTHMNAELTETQDGKRKTTTIRLSDGNGFDASGL